MDKAVYSLIEIENMYCYTVFFTIKAPQDSTA